VVFLNPDHRGQRPCGTAARERCARDRLNKTPFRVFGLP
jgi:hypothetical protein